MSTPHLPPTLTHLCLRGALCVQAVDGAKEVLGVPQELRDWIFDHVVRLKHRAQVHRPASPHC